MHNKEIVQYYYCKIAFLFNVTFINYGIYHHINAMIGAFGEFSALENCSREIATTTITTTTIWLSRNVDLLWVQPEYNYTIYAWRSLSGMLCFMLCFGFCLRLFTHEK